MATPWLCETTGKAGGMGYRTENGNENGKWAVIIHGIILCIMNQNWNRADYTEHNTNFWQWV